MKTFETEVIKNVIADEKFILNLHATPKAWNELWIRRRIFPCVIEIPEKLWVGGGWETSKKSCPSQYHLKALRIDDHERISNDFGNLDIFKAQRKIQLKVG